MRCKQGDVVRVIRPGPFYGFVLVVTEWEDLGHGPEWYYEGEPIRITSGECAGEEQLTFFDRVLMPLRNSDGVDEMLRIAGNPINEEIKRLNDKLTEALERIERVKEKTHG